MAFNEDQIFYACLWWAKHLPGGKDHADAICARYNKPAVTFPYYNPEYKPYDATQIKESAVAREFNEYGLKERLAKIRDGSFDRAAMAEISEPLTPEQIDTFFDELFHETKFKAVKVIEDNPNVKFNFIELNRSAVMVGTDGFFSFCDEIEMAMNRADIPRGKLPQFGNLDIYSDGQMFVRETQSGERVHSVMFDYPNKPALPYKHFSLTAQDMDSYPRLSRKNTYRVVPLEEGQQYRVTFPMVGGKQFVSEPRRANEGDAILIQRHEFADPKDFDLLSNEDIINLHPSVRSFGVNNPERILDGTAHLYPTRGERTGSPHIINQYMDNIAYMIVDRPVQVGRFFDYDVAQPGDYIIRETEKSSPKIIRKQWIDEGKVTFVLPDAQNPAPGTKGPRLN